MISNGIKVINSKQLLRNFEEIKRAGGGKKICVMVKADGYGHGIEKISRMLLNKADFLGVSNINEAFIIRKLSKTVKILIVGKTYCFDECLENNISFIIESVEQFQALLSFLRLKNNYNNCINIHIKINTGMNRLGINSVHEFKNIYEISKIKGIKVEGIATHFATADCDKRYLEKQIKCLKKFLREIPKDENPIVNIGGSAVLDKKNEEVIKNLNFDMVRMGIALYGYNAEDISEKIKPVLKIESKITKIFNLKKGEYLGYSKGFKAEQEMKIGIIPLGYGDGIWRNLSNKGTVDVLTKNGRLKHSNKCAIVGNICMDMFFINLTNLKFAKEGDKVIIGRDIKKWSEILQTIPYEILTNFGHLR